MLNISNLKEGDTVVFRNGGRSCAEITFGKLRIAGFEVGYWDSVGKTMLPTPDLDIIEIIPKPEPVVHEIYMNYYPNYIGNNTYRTLQECNDMGTNDRICIFKLTVTDGVPSIDKLERVET